MADPTDPPIDDESAQRVAEESVKYSHPGAPTPPGDEDTTPGEQTGGVATGESVSDQEQVRYSHPGSPTPPGDAGN